MSSHHIIREDQEPALLIDDASDVNYESIQQLLEWSPTVLVTERALAQVSLWGIKLDVVIAAEDQVDRLKTELANQSPLKILSCTHPDDPRVTALYFLTASRQKAVTVISTAALDSFEAFSGLDIAVIQHGNRWVFIRSGNYEKWLPAGSILSIYPQGAHADLHVQRDGTVTVHRNHSFWVCEK